MVSLKLFIVVICLAVGTTAKQGFSSQISAVPIVNQVLDVPYPEVILWDYTNERTEKGYRYVYQTSDNSYRLQEGMILNPSTDKEEFVVTGRYSYRIGDIETIVEYTADKNGYRPQVHIRWLPILSIPPKLLGSLAG